MSKIKMSIKELKELVSFCGGDPSKVEEWNTNIENNTPKTIEELKRYPLKKDFSFLLSEDVAPNFRRVFVDSIDWDKYEHISLDFVLDSLEEYVYECVFGGDLDDEEEKEAKELIAKVHKELIDLKFGSMVYDW